MWRRNDEGDGRNRGHAAEVLDHDSVYEETFQKTLVDSMPGADKNMQPGEEAHR